MDVSQRTRDTFHDDKDFQKSPRPELLTRIKIDLKRLFVTVIDHTTGQGSVPSM